MLTEAWPTAPIARGTDPLPPPPMAIEQLNATNPERRLIAAFALAVIVVCFFAFVVLLKTMPNPELAVAPLPPPPVHVETVPAPRAPVASAPEPIEPAPAPAPRPIVAAPSAPAPAPKPQPVVAAAAPAHFEPVDPTKKPAHHQKRHVKKGETGDIEIWPPVHSDPKDSRLAAPPAPEDDDDGPGNDLKRPSF
jgi:hypothetical protein